MTPATTRTDTNAVPTTIDHRMPDLRGRSECPIGSSGRPSSTCPRQMGGPRRFRHGKASGGIVERGEIVPEADRVDAIRTSGTCTWRNHERHVPRPALDCLHLGLRERRLPVRCRKADHDDRSNSLDCASAARDYDLRSGLTRGSQHTKGWLRWQSVKGWLWSVRRCRRRQSSVCRCGPAARSDGKCDPEEQQRSRRVAHAHRLPGRGAFCQRLPSGQPEHN
jgi:hypothetical protein